MDTATRGVRRKGDRNLNYLIFMLWRIHKDLDEKKDDERKFEVKMEKLPVLLYRN